MIIVIINGMSIVYVQMYTIDVCYLACVRVFVLAYAHRVVAWV